MVIPVLLFELLVEIYAQMQIHLVGLHEVFSFLLSSLGEVRQEVHVSADQP